MAPSSSAVSEALATLFPLKRSVDGLIGLLDPKHPANPGSGALGTELVDGFPDRAALEAAVAEFLREVRENTKAAEAAAEGLLDADAPGRNR
jgi:hypothetical protein